MEKDRLSDCTAFERDVLVAIAILESSSMARDAVDIAGQDQPHGLAVRSWLEALGGYESINHGRLYPNLDGLVDKGLVKKDELDRRTNGYTTTARGRRELAVHALTALDAFGGYAAARDLVGDS